ncbi:hypothetical protein CSAL01_07790 [Colletotrichum salicis]|uniref:Uncharacterized protein n=1 Tax=Colletotrichum salicis TaxID=1209931 RepID=A0A135U489_9PEZI|nr:hypothetical protein CSAL01_07790 [Colletotrichum salicis]
MDCQPLHHPTWRTSHGLGSLRGRLQHLPAEVLLDIVEQILESKSKPVLPSPPPPPPMPTLVFPGLPAPTPPSNTYKPNMPALATLFYLGTLNDRLRDLVTPIIQAHERKSTSSTSTGTSKDPSGFYSYVLIYSARKGFYDGVIAALDHGADINAHDGIDASLAADSIEVSGSPMPTGSHLTALHWAAFDRDLTILRLLLDRGADVRRTANRFKNDRAPVQGRSRPLRMAAIPRPSWHQRPRQDEVNALDFALQGNYGVLPSGMTEQERLAFIKDRDMRDEQVVRILVEAGCPAFVEEHTEREWNYACEEVRWGAARDILSDTACKRSKWGGDMRFAEILLWLQALLDMTSPMDHYIKSLVQLHYIRYV